MIRQTLLLFFLGYIWPTAITAQPELGQCAGGEQDVREGVAGFVEKAQSNWRRGNMREAERYLNQAVRMNDTFAHALYLLGEIQFQKAKMRQAEALWKRLLKVCPDYKPQVNFFVGVMELENGKPDRAIDLINRFLKNSEREFGLDADAERTLAEAKLRKKLRADPLPYDPKPVEKVSTQGDEYLASISPDQRLLFFTRRAKKTLRRDGPAAKVRFVEEFSKATRLKNGKFTEGKPMPAPFNQKFNEGAPSITATNAELYFTVCQDLEGYKNCDIYYAQKDTLGYWSTPQSIGDHINTRDHWESQPTVDAEGEHLYFASDQPGGIGGLDIFHCSRLPDGTWSAPEALPAPVNTPKNEKTPFIHSDSETLYFTSNGHLGMGGFDIFYVRRKDSSWQEPVNMGYPINKAGDDLGLFVSLDGQTAYFASNKLRSATGWDLYSFELPPQARPQEVALVTGRLQQRDTTGYQGAQVVIKNLQNRETNQLRVDLKTGRYAGVVKATPGADLVVKAQKRGTAFSARYISTDSLSEFGAAEAELELASLEVGKEYTLNDINFASDSYALTPAAKAVIEEFLVYLQAHPQMKADIQGHTDNVGGEQSNLDLSRNRARTVYEYLVDKGVSPQRLSHHGYGEQRPIASNDTPEGRAQNRRTVFVVTAR